MFSLFPITQPFPLPSFFHFQYLTPLLCHPIPLHLLESLYGLKQASNNWYLKLLSVLLFDGFTQIAADHSLYTWTIGSSFTFDLVYVDAILVVGNDFSAIINLTIWVHDWPPFTWIRI